MTLEKKEKKKPLERFELSTPGLQDQCAAARGAPIYSLLITKGPLHVWSVRDAKHVR